MPMLTLKPIQRSPMRMALGRTYFRLKRLAAWHLPGTAWAGERTMPAEYPHVLFTHRTPLLRRLIGNPTARRGFLPGMVLHNGKLQAEVGGGLCQLSNLIYWMTLHTPLTVVERWRHNYDSTCT